MKAIVFDDYGDPDVLHTADIDQPIPGSGKIRIRVVTAGINPLDTKVRSGAMKEVMRTHFPAIPGFEIAGFVDAIGDGVTDVAIGDAVLGWADTAPMPNMPLRRPTSANRMRCPGSKRLRYPSPGKQSIEGCAY